MELTDIYAAGEVWWTLGFEATGPGDLPAGELEAAADLVFGRVLPGFEPPLASLVLRAVAVPTVCAD